MGKYSTEKSFICRSRKRHGWKYDYSHVSYSHCGREVKIICPKHGEFMQSPSNHLKTGGCRECFKESLSSDLVRAGMITQK